MQIHQRFNSGFWHTSCLIGLCLVGFQNSTLAENHRIEIVSTGGADEDTDWTYTSGTITASADVSINASDVSDKLAAGNLTISANQIFVASDIIASSSNRLTLFAGLDIGTQQNVKIQSDGGDLVFWTNPTAANNVAAGIHLQEGTSLNTANGSTASDLSGGGNIIMGGGADANNDGYPDGFAKTNGTYGLKIDTGVKLHSGGGDVILRGETYNTNTNRHGILQTGDLTIDAGVGAIVMEGKNREGYGSWAMQLGSGTVSNLSLISAKPTGDAITLKTQGGRFGINTGGTAGATPELKATGGGNILLQTPQHIQTADDYVFETTGSGTITFKSEEYIRLGERNKLQTNNADIVFWTNSTAANNVAGGIRLGNATSLNTANGSTASDLSGGGNIILSGGPDTNNDGYPDGFAKTNGTYGLEIDTGVKLHSGGGDVILRGETYNTNTNPHGILQTGDLTIDAGVGAIVMEGKNREGYGSWPMQLGSGTVSNLSLISAKPTGDAITLKTSTGRYGTYLGGTAGATIEIKATGGGAIIVAAKREIRTTDDYTFQTNGGDIVMWPNNAGDKRGRLEIGDNNTFNSVGGQTDQATGGGDVIFAGGTDDGNNRPSGYARDDTNNYGIDLRTGLEIYSGGGKIIVKGSTNKYNTTSTRGIRQLGDLAIYSGEGAIIFDGKILRTTGVSGAGIEFADGTSNTVSVVSDKSSGDAITIDGNDTQNAWGIYFGATTNGLFEATSGGNILVTSARGIYTHDNYTFQTNGGDIVTWPNNTASNKGRLYIGSNNTFNSVGGQTNQATGGGDVIFAGGTDDGNNRPSGYARDDTNNYGIDLRTGLEIYSGGGEIIVKGSTNKYNTTSTRGIRQLGDLAIYSGVGAIHFDGKTRSTSGVAGYSVEFAYGTSNTVSVVSDKSSGDAITINGNDTNSTYGIYFGPTASGLFEASSGGSILMKTARGIYTGAYTFQTHNSDIIFWADSDADGDGRIYVRDPMVCNSAGGSTNQNTGGGDIILAGGLDDGADGGTANDGRPDGFAYDKTWRGVYLGDGVEMYSGGGDVAIRGRTYTTGNTYGILQQNDLLINSGEGKITLNGKTRTSHDGEGVLLANGGTTNGFSLISDKPSGTAIEITGEGHSYGVISGSGTSSKTIEATGGGAVVINGQTPSAGYSVYLRDFDILSADGPITVEGYSTDIYLYDSNFGQLADSLVTSSAADITFRTDELRTAGSSAIETTGGVRVEPYNASFDGTFTYPIANLSVSTSASALTVGKLSNIEDVVVESSTTVDGPITIFGGDITLNADTQIRSTGSQTDTAVVASGNFINNAGSSALLADSGRWIVYLADSQNNNYGDLNSENIPLQASTYDTLSPSDVPSGNRYVFAEAISSDFTISARDVSKTYGDHACLAQPCPDEPNARFLKGYSLLSGIAPEPNAYLGGDAASEISLSEIYSELPTITSTKSEADSSVGTAPIEITGGVAKEGYTIALGEATSTLTVVPRNLSLSGPQKLYDGTRNATIDADQLRNLANDDELSIESSTATYASKDVGGDIDVTITELTLGGTASSNYAIPENQTVPGRIEPRVVQLRATKAYDGTNQLDGYVKITTGTDETLSHTGAVAASPEIAGPDGDPATEDNYITAITLLDATDGSGGLTSNYTRPTLNATSAPAFILDGEVATINAWADDQSDPSKEPTAADYQEAGVTGITSENVDLINQRVAESDAADLDSVSDIQTLTDSVLTAQSAALEKIKDYASDPANSPVPTVDDYTDAGVTGVNASNLYVVNYEVTESAAQAVDERSELQALVNYVLETINDDSDGDGLTDYDELIRHGSNPLKADSSGDGIEDNTALDAGLDPTVSYNAIVNDIQNKMVDLRAGSKRITPSDNGKFRIELQLERSTDLRSWSQGPNVIHEVTPNGPAEFYRFRLE